MTFPTRNGHEPPTKDADTSGAGYRLQERAAEVDQPKRVVMTDQESRQLSELFVDILQDQ